MSRYRIVEIDEMYGNVVTDTFGDEIGILYSEEETLDKFKEIWDASSESTWGNVSDYPLDIDKNRIAKDWEKFKEKL